jgi:hypothetical protein
MTRMGRRRPILIDEATAEALSSPFQAVFEQYFQELSHRRLANSPTD